MGYFVEKFGACAPFIIEMTEFAPYATMVVITLIVCLTIVYVVRRQKSWSDNNA